MDGHIGCFHVLAAVNSAAVNTGVSFSKYRFFWVSARSGLRDPRGNSVFSFLRSLQTPLHEGCTNFRSRPQGGAPLLPAPSPAPSHVVVRLHVVTLSSLFCRARPLSVLEARAHREPRSSAPGSGWGRRPRVCEQPHCSWGGGPGARSGTAGGWALPPRPAGASQPSALLHRPWCRTLALTVQQGPRDSPSRKKRTRQEREEAMLSTEENVPEGSGSHAVISQPRPGPDTQSALRGQL